MSVKDRLPKIKEAAKQVVLCLNKSHFEYIYGLRSVKTNYQIRIKWTDVRRLFDIEFTQITCECHKVAGVGQRQPTCQGNSNGTVCYHSLAQDKGMTFVPFDSFRCAVNYCNLGGRLIKVVSSQGQGVLLGCC